MIILGGVKHGERIWVEDHAHQVMMLAQQTSRFKVGYIPQAYFDAHYADDLTVNIVSYRLIKLPLSPTRAIRAAVHPDISEDTARRLLADLVTAAWERAA